MKKVWKYWHSLWQMRKGYNYGQQKTEFLGMYEFLHRPDRWFRRIRTDRYRNRTDRTRRTLRLRSCSTDRCMQLVPMATLASSMPATGGSYVYAKKLIGPRASFVFLMMFVLQQVLIATFAIGFASYVAVIFPDVNQKLVALGALTLAVVVNMIGLKTSAKVQKFMVALLLDFSVYLHCIWSS